ncbi:MAG TPA: hypothetical protein VF836_01865 [Gemmatimonadaceae bacterium]
MRERRGWNDTITSPLADSNRVRSTRIVFRRSWEFTRRQISLATQEPAVQLLCIASAIVLLSAAMSTIAADAAPLVAARTEVRTLTSKANGVTYTLYVSLPHGYGQPGKTFPVVYLPDANYSFFIARNITDHLSERNDLREFILVGIGYDTPKLDTFAWQSESYHYNRTGDHTPKFLPTGGYGPEMQKVSGGGPQVPRHLRIA